MVAVMEQGYWIKGIRAKQGAHDTIDNITKFSLTNDDYEEYEEWVPYPREYILNNRISELKNKLSDTDYMVIKIAEGVATFEEYADTLEERQLWRAEINELEIELALIEE
jgi:hypothetical protein